MSLLGTMLKVKIDDVKVDITTRFHKEGAVLAGTVQGRPLEFDCRVTVKSPEPSEKIANMIRMADDGCFVLQSLVNPVTVNRSFALNGQELKV